MTEAFNVLTGTSLWTASPGWKLVAAQPNGGATGLGSNGELLSISATGQLDASTMFGLARPIHVSGNVIGQGTTTAELRAVAFDSMDATRWMATLERVAHATYEPSVFGNKEMQFAPHTPFCEVPPLWPANSAGQSYYKGSDVFYKFLPTQDATCKNNDCAWTPERMRKVKDAFEEWNRANIRSGLRTKFREDTANTGYQLSLFIIKQPNASTGSHVVTAFQGGQITFSTMTFNVAPNKIGKTEVFYKVAEHEIGHSLGLGENYTRNASGAVIASGISGSSVMNALSDPFDSFGNVPWEVTICDRNQAKAAARRLWPE